MSIITLVVAVFQSSVIGADLDSLLGDWASEPAPEVKAEIDENSATLSNPESQTLASHGNSVGFHSPPIVPNPYVVEACNGCDAPATAPCDCQTPAAPCCGSGCELLDRHRFIGLSECRPHEVPVLPTSTFLQYFRSRNSYSNIWAGYCDETRHRPRNRSHHLHGTACGCDGCGQLIEPGCQCDACDR